jgi:putative N6-adenine-specific DNA methylase
VANKPRHNSFIPPRVAAKPHVKKAKPAPKGASGASKGASKTSAKVSSKAEAASDFEDVPENASEKTASVGAVAYEAWAVAAPGVEALLERELRTIGFADATASPGGVSFECDAAGLARANLHSRLASRIVVRLAAFRATAFYELERSARKIDWARFIRPKGAFRLRVTAKKSKLYHSDAIAQRVAEAVVRAVPSAVAVALKGKDDEGDAIDSPEASAADGSQLIVVRFDRDECTISADSSGELLHRRGYRQAVARAPLRETLAAAMLAAVGYDASRPLVDPFCGSGTLVIEAAMLARDIAPGLQRSFAAERWPEARAAVWRTVRDEARARIKPSAGAPLIGSDRDAGAIEAAQANAARAGVSADVQFVQRALSDLEVPEGPGLLIANPPYGVRVGERAPLRDLYARLGQVVRTRCVGWRVTLLSPDRALEGQTGLRFSEVLKTHNGGIPVRVVTASV